MMKIRTMVAGVVATLTLCGLLASAASAARVTTTRDGGPGSLRQAIADANPGETITLPPGDYLLTEGELQIRSKSLTISGAGAASTTISAGGHSRVFEIRPGAGNTVVISGVTIRDGLFRRETTALGGAIRVLGGSFSLLNDVLAANVVEAIHPEDLSGTAQGSALFFEGETLRIGGSKFVGNVARASRLINGGAIFAFGDELSLERSTIEGTIAEARGSEAFQDAGEVIGAGATLLGLGSQTVIDSTIADNVADARPVGEGFPGLAFGGGLFFALETGAKSSIVGSTIVGNEALTGNGFAAGGGLAVAGQEEELSPVEVTATTIASNSLEGSPDASFGSSVTTFSTGAVAFNSSILANGLGAANCGASGPEGRIVDNGFNLDSADSCGFHGVGDIVKTNPLLGPLRDNGGTTRTLLPAAKSPVIDQGSAKGPVVDPETSTVFGRSTDQRGLRRTVDLPKVRNSTAPGADGTDIGAVEVQR
jgi:hypothetical protein